MLTTVYLDGPLGKRFGKKWELDCETPGEALRLIEVNMPGMRDFIRDNLAKYDNYKVVCTYENGRTEALDNDTLKTARRPSTIRFVPVLKGRNAGARIVAGVALLVVAYFLPPAYVGAAAMLGGIGASLVIGGVVQLLTPQPKTPDQDERKDKTSHYYDGPTNTTMQGVPVQLIYGQRVLVGSHVISAQLTIDQDPNPFASEEA